MYASSSASRSCGARARTNAFTVALLMYGPSDRLWAFLVAQCWFQPPVAVFSDAKVVGDSSPRGAHIPATGLWVALE